MALVAVHRVIVAQAAGTDALVHPLDRLSVVSLVDTLPDRADNSLPGLPRLCCRQTTQPRKTMKRTTARVARI